jgi:hypothetical protein
VLSSGVCVHHRLDRDVALRHMDHRQCSLYQGGKVLLGGLSSYSNSILTLFIIFSSILIFLH